MITQRIFSSSLIFSAVLAISACGGTNALTLEEVAKQFTTSVTSGIAALTGAAGLNSNALPSLFADNYKDGGFTKADVVSTLAANSTALPTAPELSLFPMAAITNTAISGCDNNGICTLSGTLTNSDVDTTSVDFSTKVIVVGGVVYFYGDQSSTSSI